MPTGSPSVLVVEDEQDIADGYANALSSFCDVETAYNGKSALRKIDDELDMLLLDRRMPDISGDEVLEEVIASGIDCRTIMVTAVNPDFDLVEMAVDHYLTKPVDIDELEATVRQQLKQETYQQIERKLSSLRLKRNVLEIEKTHEQLQASEEFATLEERIGTLEAELAEIKSQLDSAFTGEED
jgi:DNA-binding response OmpR family regulator